MEIGEAVRAVKDGKRIARDEWSGIGQYISYIPATKRDPVADLEHEIVGKDGMIAVGDYLMFHASNRIPVPWCPTSDDILANDWRIV